MLEYGGMSNEDVNDLLAQHDNDQELDQTMREMFKYNDISILKGSDSKADGKVADQISVTSSTDSDFVDVPDADSDINDETNHDIGIINAAFHKKPVLEGNVEVTLDDIQKIKSKKPLQIVVNTQNIDEEDIFADIFMAPKVNSTKANDNLSTLSKLPVTKSPNMSTESTPEKLQTIDEENEDEVMLESSEDKPKATVENFGSIRVRTDLEDIKMSIRSQLTSLKEQSINLDDISIPGDKS
jgi:hypothetical protein